jgi:trans-aconitate methyltransferase
MFFRPLVTLFAFLVLPAFSFWSGVDYAQNASLQKSTGEDFIKYLGSKIDAKAIKELLVIGVGTGQNLPLLLEVFPNAVIQGDEPSQSMASCTQSLYADNPRVKIDVRAAQDIQAKDSYNMVFSSYVLHWISREDITKVFSLVNSSLKPQGIFVSKFANNNMIPDIYNRFATIGAKQKYKAALADFVSPMSHHDLTFIVEQLTSNGFLIQEIHFRRDPYIFDDRDSFARALKQWLPRYIHIKKTAPDLADAYIEEYIDEFLVDSMQESGGKVITTVPIIEFIATKR